MLPRAISEIHIASGFQKSFQKLPAKIQNVATQKDQIFRKNAFDPRLKTHRLRGELEGYWAYTINYSYRVLFRFINGDKAIYYDVGTHSIYKY